MTCRSSSSSLPALRGVPSVLLCLASLLTCASTAARQLDVAVDPADKSTAREAVVENATARGTVFTDLNENGRRDANEPGMAGVRLSNGSDIVETDANGDYAIPLPEDSILFVIKPRGYRTRFNDNNLPLFYYIHKPAGSPKLRFPGVPPTGSLPEAIDFPLYPQEEPESFKAILFGDTQPRNAKEIGYMNQTTIPELIGTDASFGVTLGDILFDDLSLFEYQNESVARIGIPWYNVLGNHDINFDTSERRYANETYERWYGPSYYSFDFGNVHFIVLDNINWYIPDGESRGTYDGTFGEQQLTFVEKDLASVPEDQLVVMFMHIPLTVCKDANALYRLIEKRPFTFSVSAHQHYHRHIFVGNEQGWQGDSPHHHMVNVTVCGAWWTGRPGPDGVPHATMTDGGPHGYSIVTFADNQYTVDFKAAGLPADYQMRIDVPNAIPASELADTQVFANVFNGSEKSSVAIRFDNDGAWQDMERVIQPDPYFLRLYEAEEKATPPIEPGMAKAADCYHLWKSGLPSLAPGVHLVEVRATDMHDRQFTSKRIIRVTE